MYWVYNVTRSVALRSQCEIQRTILTDSLKNNSLFTWVQVSSKAIMPHLLAYNAPAPPPQLTSHFINFDQRKGSPYPFHGISLFVFLRLFSFDKHDNLIYGFQRQIVLKTSSFRKISKELCVLYYRRHLLLNLNENIQRRLVLDCLP